MIQKFYSFSKTYYSEDCFELADDKPIETDLEKKKPKLKLKPLSHDIDSDSDCESVHDYRHYKFQLNTLPHTDDIACSSDVPMVHQRSASTCSNASSTGSSTSDDLVPQPPNTQTTECDFINYEPNDLVDDYEHFGTSFLKLNTTEPQNNEYHLGSDPNTITPHSGQSALKAFSKQINSIPICKSIKTEPIFIEDKIKFNESMANITSTTLTPPSPSPPLPPLKDQADHDVIACNNNTNHISNNQITTNNNNNNNNVNSLNNGMRLQWNNKLKQISSNASTNGANSFLATYSSLMKKSAQSNVVSVENSPVPAVSAPIMNNVSSLLVNGILSKSNYFNEI